MRLAFVVPSLFVLCAGCKFFDTTCKSDDRMCLSNPLLAKGVGGACERNVDCKAGLDCMGGECTPTGNARTGEACRLTAECGDADYCGSQRICQLAGVAEDGAGCLTTGECQHGLVCEPPDLSQLGSISLGALADSSGTCQEGGGKEQGEPCDTIAECLAGLSCAQIPDVSTGKICTNLPPMDFDLPAIPFLWDGVECPVVEPGDTKVSYFAVPRAGEKPKPSEFYSLPFPNDVRLRGGRIDMSGHPVAPSDSGLPFVERYIEVAGEDLDGFSTNPVIFFRFSHRYDFESVHGRDSSTGSPATLMIVDITPGSPEYDREASIEWKTTSGDLSNYICPHWLAMRRPVGEPLRPGTTYAAVITGGIRPNEGGNYARGDDFDAMLQPSAPADSALRDAYDAYAPLREWIDDTGTSSDAILNAAVFTTQQAEGTVAALRSAVRTDGVPSISDVTLCQSASTASPCETMEPETETDPGGTRGGCQAASSSFTEIHAKLTVPIFQQGEAPYLEPEDGGGFELDGNGRPVVQRHEEVCIAISVPTAPAPATGYPVLVYGHGTGGVFNGELDAGGLSGVLASANTPSVLIGLDLPQHGARRGASTDPPDGLFYNFLNPRAARDNVLQGSADLMSVIHWVEQGGGLASGSPLPNAVSFDPLRIALMGHSQGSTHSALIASYESSIIGVVLSGNGGHLATSMLTKTRPVDIAAVVPIGLLDPDSNFKLAGGGYNPALAIIQSVFDRADPISYARRLYREPVDPSTTGVHAFMTYGLDDSFSPEETQEAYAVAGNLTQVAPLLVPLGGLNSATAPLSQNASVNGTQRTIGMRQYQPSGGVDGHFVGVSQGQDGRPDVEHFLELLLDGQAPEIGGP